ncbi:hypothetical protein ACLOJK_011841 [Asimina triloba]
MAIATFLLLLFFSSFATATSNNSRQQSCAHDHFSALLQLKRGFRFHPFYSTTNLSSWTPHNRDCCSWEGIGCDRGLTATATASHDHVTHLDLGEFYILGRIDFQSIFSIRSLKKLSLAYNLFDPCPIPPGLTHLTSLTHLNLSNANFYGKIPSSIGHLTSLVSLDLSCSPDFFYLDEDGFFSNSCHWKLEIPSIEQLVQKMSSLTELYLSWANISAEASRWSRVLPSSLPRLRSLRLRGCLLSGPIHSSFSQLHFLSQLDLSNNNLSSVVPGFIANFSSLTSLELSSCRLHGSFPKDIFMLPALQTLDVSQNSLAGSSPEFPLNSTLQYLDLSDMQFSAGRFPESLKNLNFLTALGLDNCSISGSLPSWLADLRRLESLQLAENNFSGPIPSSYGRELLNLRSISMSRNQISGSIPPSLFSLPLLENLALEFNQLGGELGEFQNARSSRLEILLLGKNNLQGIIPSSMFELGGLTIIYLSSNNFSGTLDLSLFANFQKLIHLDLSDNSFSVEAGSGNLTTASFPQLSMLNLRSCNIKEFPSVLRNQEALTYVDLSNNRIRGEIPNWIWEVGSGRLLYLNLSHNALNGIEPPFPYVSLKRLHFLDLSSNLIEGSLVPSSTFFPRTVPMSICNSTFLQVLDLSDNLFSGQVPPCLGETSNVLSVLNLRRNNFSGSLPQTFKEGCSLTTIDVSGNKLEGQVPRSLPNCKMLEVINLGNNQMHDTFPFSLGILSQLRVLVLRSNKFYGPIVSPLSNPTKTFTMLQIMDLSSNDFTGSLPSDMFWTWKAMMGESSSSSMFLNRSFFLGGYYQDKVTIVNKYLEMKLVKILTAFTVLDFSNNKFHGSIPSSIGDLKSLLVLNMSNNDLEGGLPASLGNVRALESLDLSHNRLSGEIPWQLSDLTFLSVLDLSQNLLVGRIPQSQQFLTFPKESFLGNLGLCGFPLPAKCEDEEVPNSPLPWEEYESGLDWDMDSELDGEACFGL